MEKLQSRIAEQHELIASHDQSDFEGLGVLSQRLAAIEGEVAELETSWLQLSELLEP